MELKEPKIEKTREQVILGIKAELDAIQELLKKGAKGTESIQQGGLDKLNEVSATLKQTREFLSVLDLNEDEPKIESNSNNEGEAFEEARQILTMGEDIIGYARVLMERIVKVESGGGLNDDQKQAIQDAGAKAKEARKFVTEVLQEKIK